MPERRRGPGDLPAASQLQRGDRPLGLVRPGAVALTSDLERLRRDLHRVLRGGADAVEPRALVTHAVHQHAVIPATPLFVVAAGKGAWRMASGLEGVASRLRAGIVAGPARADVPIPPAFEHFDTGHPAPDRRSERAARRALDLAAASRDGGTLLVLLSGGASAMLALPAEGLRLDEKGSATLALMRAGVPIEGLNCVRKHLSAIKGGRLAAAARRSVTFAISDVHGPPIADDPAVIGSGPTVADPTTFADAYAVITDSGADVPPNVTRHLQRGVRGVVAETPKPGDSRLDGASYHLLANRHTAVDGAAALARRLGYHVEVLSPATHGEAREAARAFVSEGFRLAQRARTLGQKRPVCIIGSGETTVRVRGAGRGGRNQEFALAAAPILATAHADGFLAIVGSVGTDGIDGPTPAAGAMADWTTTTRACALGLSADEMLARNASHDFFEPLGDLIVWGPTGTNVGDVHVMLNAEC